MRRIYQPYNEELAKRLKQSVSKSFKGRKKGFLEQIAKELGYDKDSIENYLSGRTLIPAAFVMILYEKYNINIFEVFGNPSQAVRKSLLLRNLGQARKLRSIDEDIIQDLFRGLEELLSSASKETLIAVNNYIQKQLNFNEPS